MEKDEVWGCAKYSPHQKALIVSGRLQLDKVKRKRLYHDSGLTVMMQALFTLL